jgi:large subunit ribosomal protein L20
MKALKYAYRGRKLKKRNFRSLWIVRINAALRQKNLKYNNFIAMLKQKNIGLNRKVLSQLAVIDNETFDLLIEKVKK